MQVTGMLRQVPFHPVHQVGFIEEMSIHSEQPQHDQAKVARDFGSSADGVALATGAFDTRPRVEEGDLRRQFPAGKVEAGEAAERTAVRGTQEETSLTVGPCGKCGGVLSVRFRHVAAYTGSF
ncbi:NUDIX hydrolase [Streptomyces sp. CT34]|uniref:NUDIX hydrolase n=1 Tax=Streptomyces sp. CT34 TaxID=1553907 RepID=UPI0032209A7C